MRYTLYKCSSNDAEVCHAGCLWAGWSAGSGGRDAAGAVAAVVAGTAVVLPELSWHRSPAWRAGEAHAVAFCPSEGGVRVEYRGGIGATCTREGGHRRLAAWAVSASDDYAGRAATGAEPYCRYLCCSRR